MVQAKIEEERSLEEALAALRQDNETLESEVAAMNDRAKHLMQCSKGIADTVARMAPSGA